MLIKQCHGYELEKEQSNTSEDFFNRSEITFVEEDKERTLHVLYVRYFDELISKFTPYEADPIFNVGERDVYIRDIVALACLLTNPGYRHRKRVYINNQEEYADLFNGLEFGKLHEIFEGLEQQGHIEIRSPLDYVAQPI